MPSRLIREGILSSDRVDLLSEAGEVFYRRLFSKVDDHGLFDGRPSVLRAALYPLRLEPEHPRFMSTARLVTLLEECVAADLIEPYEVDGKPFLRVLDTRWTARSEPKFPLPHAIENSRAQVNTTVHLDGDGDGVVGGVEDVVGVVVEKGASAPRPPTRKRTDDAKKTGIGEWQPDADLRAWALQERLDLTAPDVDRLVDGFRDHYLANGERRASWPASWRSWVRKDLEFNGRRRPNGQAPPGRPRTLQEQRAANVDELTGKGKRDRTERTIEGTAERVDREALRALPGDLR